MRVKASCSIPVVLCLASLALTYYMGDVVLPSAFTYSSRQMMETTRRNITLSTGIPFSKDLKGNTGLQVNRTSIRKWGCSRTDSPFIFVHVGELKNR